jgi:glutamine synthetase
MSVVLSSLETVRVAAVDLNGQWRGKRLPAAAAAKLEAGGFRMPLSALNVDIFGADIEDSPLVFETGDQDGVGHPTGRGPLPMPWLATPSALVPVTMQRDGGAAYGGDPRYALEAVLARFAERGLSVTLGIEVEFMLVDAREVEAPRPPLLPGTARRPVGPAILSIQEIDAFDAFFTDLYRAAGEMGVGIGAAISEAGLGQFELTLAHGPALRAADDAALTRLLVHGLARRHGLAATFMAKPYAEQSGNGLHLHFSVIDETGANVFDDGGPAGSDALRHAVAGCLAAMPASTLVFAPHANSYARFTEGAHAPTSAAWGYENRTVALRVPGGAPAARRIEHRVAGADTNPYLVAATVLGAALAGIEAGAEPPPPLDGNAYAAEGLPELAPSWKAAIDAFAGAKVLEGILPPRLRENLVLTKRQELRKCASLSPEAIVAALLEAV